MRLSTVTKSAILLATILAVASCGRLGRRSDLLDVSPASNERLTGREAAERGTTIWEAFRQRDSGDKVAVNRYLWNASLEVLDFLPVQSVDPFTGVIVTGYGTPPGGGRAYRATVLIKDPALDARSLNVSVQSSGGRAVADGTQRAIEDAILTRARQLRSADRRF
ncbi:DUF3576 domain-containing protein [Pseudooceanicola sp. C21-150M6]|uniref:DUF3576 domain-containing protein n=1 Tax=Pseudooceanicola sp. C21-150M6 TaxID=3434355 RepID=UPI003D7F6172